MSQKSQRFLAAKEAAQLPTMRDHQHDSSSIVPSLKAMSPTSSRKWERIHQDEVQKEAAKKVEQHGPGFLDTARQQITSLTGRLVEWGKDHPARMVGAAAVLIAVTGVLLKVVKRKSRRLATVRQAAKQAKQRVKSGVRKAAATVGNTVRTGGRRSAKSRLALAHATGRNKR